MTIQAFKTADLLGPLDDAEAKHAPESLHVSGDLGLLRADRRIAVIGSRNASEDGLKRARALVRQLVSADIVVVSGLAAGVDTAAHTAAMEAGGRTIAVLGTPLDRFYPLGNQALQRRIMQEHLAISQFPPEYPTDRKNFLMRNRTMALISDAAVVVEAGEKSGTQHYAWEALRLGREVFLMENVAKNPRLTWPQKALACGAEILSRENLEVVTGRMPA